MSNLKPTAKIAINKNVVPAGTNVYLKSGQEFQIELFNPTKYNILAKIYINGESISDTGIVIRPGRREWLERYIEKAKKFKFEVYEVEADNRDVQAAIKNNGLVKVEFYKEKLKSSNTVLINDGSWINQLNSDPIIYPLTQPYWHGLPINCNNSNITFENNVTITGTNGVIHSAYDSTYNFDSLNLNHIPKKSTDNKLEETGRIEQGSYSNQTFIQVDMDFETQPLCSVEYKLLPLSKKPIQASEIRVYCTQCGARQKKTNWKFCPFCGNKFE